MKTLNKRNRTLLAIVGVLVILVIAIMAFSQVRSNGLLGTAAYVITPANPSIKQGETVTLCTPGQGRWDSADPKIVAIVKGNDKLVECIDVQGMAAGQATITAHASPYGVTQTQTIVTVR